MGKKWQVCSASLWSATELGILMQRTVLQCLRSQGTASHRNSGSVLLSRPRMKTADGSSCGTQVLPACATFATGPLGRRESWIVCVCCINRCSLQTGVSCSGSWLHIVKAGESESVLTLCLKHLDVFSLSPRSLIWVFNWTLPGSFGKNYEMDRIFLVVVFLWGKLCFCGGVWVAPSVKWEKAA